MKNRQHESHSVSTLMHRALLLHREECGMPPERILLNPAFHDIWHAELLATGRVQPGRRFLTFEGVPVVVDDTIDICEIE